MKKHASDVGEGAPRTKETLDVDSGDAESEVDAADMDADDLREAVFALETRVKKISRANFLLQGENKTLMTRIEQLQSNLEREKNEMTPRPKWRSFEEVLPEFHVNALCTSEEILEEVILEFKSKLSRERKLLEQNALSDTVRTWLGDEDLCESDLVGRHKYFVCRGTGEHVPVYLRAAGHVRNRRLKKSDVEQLIGKFWIDRRIQLRVDTMFNAQPIGDFFLEYLESFTGSRKAALELAYNVIHVCEQFQSDPDCNMFLRCLRGELSEHAVFDQMDMLVMLKDMFVLNDRSHKGVLSRFTIGRILNKFFPTKSRQDMLRLRFALMLDSGGQTLCDYNILFSEDSDANQSRLIELVRRQHVEELQTFTVEVEEALREAITGTGMMNLSAARQHLKSLDPLMPNGKIDEIVSFGCGMTPTELEAHGQYYTTEAEPFLARVRRGVLLKRFSRPSYDLSDSDEAEDDEERDTLFRAVVEEESDVPILFPAKSEQQFGQVDISAPVYQSEESRRAAIAQGKVVKGAAGVHGSTPPPPPPKQGISGRRGSSSSLVPLASAPGTIGSLAASIDNVGAAGASPSPQPRHDVVSPGKTSLEELSFLREFKAGAAADDDLMKRVASLRRGHSVTGRSSVVKVRSPATPEGLGDIPMTASPELE